MTELKRVREELKRVREELARLGLDYQALSSTVTDGPVERFQAQILEALPIGVWVVDMDGILRLSNAEGRRLWEGARWGSPPPVGESLAWDEEGRTQLGPKPWGLARTVFGGEVIRDTEIVIHKGDGTELAVLNSAAPLYGDDGKMIGGVVVNRDITERKTTEEELRTRADREALVGRIGQAVLWNADPEALQSTALSLLGERLEADRCFYVLYDEGRNTATIEKDWCREGVPSLSGEWDLTERGMHIMDIYAGGRPAVVEDVAAVALPPNLVALFLETGQRSYIAVPIFDQGRPVAALTVMMASAARTWSGQEVALVEAAAIQVRGAVEAVRAAQREREAQARQRAFMRDVLLSVTESRLFLCHAPSDLPAPLLPSGGPVSLTRESGLRELRHLALEAAEGMAEESRHDLITAASEAGMNAIVHGGGGTGWVSVGGDGTVQVRVEDHGSGIAMENLPRATLSRGFSTKATLGHGLKMMLETIDRLYLLTGPTGTTVVLEQERERPLPAWL